MIVRFGRACQCGLRLAAFRRKRRAERKTLQFFRPLLRCTLSTCRSIWLGIGSGGCARDPDRVTGRCFSWPQCLRGFSRFCWPSSHSRIPPARRSTRSVSPASSGLGYLQFHVMQDRKLVEKQARAARPRQGDDAMASALGTPTALTDALLTGNVDFIGVGLPAFLTLWDKTRGNLERHGVVALNRQPAFLNTRIANIRSLRDFTDNDRIALPAPKVSVQAIMLEMIAEKTFGPASTTSLDELTVGMSHPDGTAAHAVRQAGDLGAFHVGAVPVSTARESGHPQGRHPPTTRPTDPTRSASSATINRLRESNPQIYRAVFAAIAGGERLHRQGSARDGARFSCRLENSKLPVAFIEKMITDPEFSLRAGAAERDEDLRLHAPRRCAQEPCPRPGRICFWPTPTASTAADPSLQSYCVIARASGQSSTHRRFDQAPVKSRWHGVLDVPLARGMTQED